MKCESAWDQTKKGTTDDIWEKYEIFHDNEWKSLGWMERTWGEGKWSIIYCKRLTWVENRTSQ